MIAGSGASHSLQIGFNRMAYPLAYEKSAGSKSCTVTIQPVRNKPSQQRLLIVLSLMTDSFVHPDLTLLLLKMKIGSYPPYVILS